ncbi:MAG: PQQ-binding-like beta-propeller repeat protein [Actinomycetota bacterium]
MALASVALVAAACSSDPDAGGEPPNTPPPSPTAETSSTESLVGDEALPPAAAPTSTQFEPTTTTTVIPTTSTMSPATTDADGRILDSSPWHFGGITPDGRHLAATVDFGGCREFDRWVVDESEVVVEVTAYVWRPVRTDVECDSVGRQQLVQIDLERPLGERDLLGCGRNECLAVDARNANVGAGEVVAVGDLVVAARGPGAEVFDRAGELVATIDPVGIGPTWPLGDDAFLRSAGLDSIVFDVATGTEIWRSAGTAVGTDDDTVYLCTGPGPDGLFAADATTGEVKWSADVPCAHAVVHTDSVTLVAIEPTGRNHRLVVVDSDTGAVISDEVVSDGTGDGGADFQTPIAVGDTTVVSGGEAALVVFAADGTELSRGPVGLGRILGQVDGLAIIGNNGVARGVDPMSGGIVWEREFPTFPPIVVEGGGVWLLDGPAGTVTSVDAATGGDLWTADVGLTPTFDVAAAGGAAYVVTTQALVALDAETGDVLWSRHRPLPL